MNRIMELKKFATATIELLKESPNCFFEEHPEIIERLAKEDWRANVDHVNEELKNGIDRIKMLEERDGNSDEKLGTFEFLWDEYDNNGFSIWLSRSNEYTKWLDLELEDYAAIDMSGIVDRIFKGIEDLEDNIRNDQVYFTDLMTALLEVSIVENIEKNEFYKCNCTDPYVITSKAWHDVESDLICKVKGKVIEELNLKINSGPRKGCREAKDGEVKIFDTIYNLDWRNHISMDNIGMKNLPQEIEKLQNAVELDISYNNIETLRKEIYNLKALESIRANNNKIDKVEDGIGNLQELKELRLSDNRIKELPKDMNNLKKLERMDLSNNSFEKFPEFLLDLDNLETIDIGNNPIKELPDGILKLPNLKEIRFSPNLFSTEERKLLREKYGDKLFLGYDDSEASFMR